MSDRIIRESTNLTFPKKPPYEKVTDYLTSVKELNILQLPNFKADQARKGPEIQLKAARNIYTKTVKALENRREFYKNERLKLDYQWKELEELERSLKDNFKKLNSFITSNQEKRVRAADRTKEDSKLVSKREQDIENIKEKMAVLEIAKKDLDKEILLHLQYGKYLNSVVAATQLEFKNSEDLLDRFESLTQTKKELGLRQSTTFNELETAKYKITKMADENAFRILGLNNILVNLSLRYQTALNNAMHWERIVWNIKKNGVAKFREITEVKQACRNIYYLMCKRKNENLKIPDDDFENHLIYIKKTLQELSKVKSEVETLNQKTFSSIKAETSKTS